MFRNHMDTTFLPCQNFYDFMCGNFKKFHTPDQKKGRMSAFGIRERYVNQKILGICAQINTSVALYIFKTSLSSPTAK